MTRARLLLLGAPLLAAILGPGVAGASTSLQEGSSEKERRRQGAKEPSRQRHLTKHEARPQENVLPPPEIRHMEAEAARPPAPPPAPPKPDERPLWSLLQSKAYKKLRSEVTRLRLDYPDWRPPRQMLLLLRHGEAVDAIGAARARGLPGAIVKLSRTYPEAFGCHRIDNLWALADDLHAQGQSGESAAVYGGILRECEKPADRMASLQKAAGKLPAPLVADLIAQEARASRSPEDQERFALFRYEFFLRGLTQAMSAGDYAGALAFEAQVSEEAVARRDARTAVLLGWADFHSESFERASEWFGRAVAWRGDFEEAAYGLTVSRLRQGDFEGAEKAAEALQAASPRLRAIVADSQIERASRRYDEGDYAESLELIERASAIRPLRRGERMLQAWAFFHSGESLAAGRAFEALYREETDEAAAEGVFSSYGKEKRWDLVESLARESGGPLARLWASRRAEEAYHQKRFLSAESIVPGKFPPLRHVASFSASGSVLSRHKSGEPGLGRLTIDRIPLGEIGFVLGGVHRLSVQADRLRLDAGPIAPGALVGISPGSGARFVFGPTTRLEDQIEPRLSYSREGALSPYAEVGRTPDGGPVGARITWKAGLLQKEATRSLGGEVFSEPVRESLLSYTGLVDPYSGAGWGRVARTGVRISTYNRLAEDWGLSGQGEWAQLTGPGLRDNTHAALSLSLSRVFTPRGLDYLAIGPVAFLDGYKKNLSRFTLGHGGYFSPRRLIQTGLGASLLTAEGRPFVLRGSLAAGYESHRQASAPLFPLDPDGRLYESTERRGAALSVELTWAWRLQEHLQLSGGLSVRKTAGFADRSGVFTLRLFARPRPAVVSSEVSSGVFGILY